MRRRDFLRPRRLAHAAGQIVAAVDSPTSPPATEAPEFAVLRAERRAMATSFEVLLPFGAADALEAAEAALDAIDRLEDQLTVYRDHSEVCRINREAAAGPVPVENALFELLALAARIHAETEGAFDVTAGALVKAWGFYRGPRRVPDVAELREVLGRVSSRHLALDAEARTVRFARPGLEINLGSIGKGYALDHAARLLRGRNFTSGLLHGGHSSVYAMGKPPGSARGWPVGLGHPWHPDRRLAVVRLADRALGTSAATFQHLEHHGRKLGHILDPRTGWPAEVVASASAVAPTAAEADALATAFFILGPEKTRAYCENHPSVAAVLLPQGQSAAPVVIGLAPEDIDLP